MARNRLRIQAINQQQNTGKKTKKAWKRRLHVNEGDLVRFHTPSSHMYGSVGTVRGYISRNEVLIETFGGQDDEWPPMKIVVDSRVWDIENWQGQNVPGEINPYYRSFLTKVIHSTNPVPRKAKSAKPKKIHVLSSHEEVLAALAGEREVRPHETVLVTLGDAMTDASDAIDAAPTDNTEAPNTDA